MFTYGANSKVGFSSLDLRIVLEDMEDNRLDQFEELTSEQLVQILNEAMKVKDRK